MNNIRENDLIKKYFVLLDNEFTLYNDNPEKLSSFSNLIHSSYIWKFAKDGDALYPYPYVNELSGYKSTKLINKKLSISEAVNKNLSLYGLSDTNQHIVTIERTSKNFGSDCRFFEYKENLVKIITLNLPDSYFIGDIFFENKKRIPILRGIKYVIWEDDKNQIILTRGKFNKNINLEKIIYKDNKPLTYISNIDNNGVIDEMEFDFIYGDNELIRIKHNASDYLIYEK